MNIDLLESVEEILCALNLPDTLDATDKIIILKTAANFIENSIHAEAVRNVVINSLKK